MIHSVNDWKSRVWWLLVLVPLLGSGAQGQEINSSTGGNSSCPGQTVVFTCARQITSHEWLLNGQQAVTLVPANLNIPIIQDGFTYSVTDAIPGPPPSIVSTATVVSTTSLNGTEVACADGTIIGGDPNPSTITALVFDTTPRNLIFQQSTPSSGRLSWTLPAGSETCVSSYSVNIVGVRVVPATDMFLDVSTSDGLVINTFYTYTVTSNPGDMSSAAGQFQIINNEPPSPRFNQSEGVVVNTSGTCSISSVTVNWVAPNITDPVRIPPVLDYTVSCSDDLCVTVSNISDTSYTITKIGIAAGTYTINVAARNSLELGAPVSMMFDVSATTITSTSTVINNSASITFTLSNTNCNTEELLVLVQSCTGANCLCSTIDYGGAMEFTHTVGNNPLSIPGLDPGSLYCYRVTISVGGVTVAMEYGSFTTMQPMPPQTFNIIIPVVVVVVVVLVIAIVVTIIVIIVCIKKKNNGKEDTKHLRGRKSPSPDGPGLYADPNTIEREAAHGTTAEYTLVNVTTKKNKPAKPTPEGALYQDPNTIEHETTPSGATYAVVDKPKRGSKKKEPDVVPPGTEGLNYADIDLNASRNRPKPASQRQPQQPVGSVEYADVQFKEDASRL